LDGGGIEQQKNKRLGRFGVMSELATTHPAMLARRMTLLDLLAETAKANKELHRSNDEMGYG
jgi:hypothetical protein